MSDFINTVDIIDDDILMDGLIEKSISGSFNDNKITTIKNGAFAYCTNLESVCFPNVTDIGAGAFTGSGLKAITPETFPSVTYVGYYYRDVVFNDSALETVDWPSLTDVNEGLFENCKSLKSVNLPNWYGDSYQPNGIAYSFRNCTSLTDVNLPVLTKGPDFTGCTSLKTITLPLATSCGNYNGCTSLQLIDLPSCSEINAQDGFRNCPLDALILRNTTMCSAGNYVAPNSYFYSFRNSGIANGTGYIYVPRDLIDSYKTTGNWTHLASQFRPLEDYTVDGTITGAMREHCESFVLNVTELTFTDANNQTLNLIGAGILDEITWTTSDKTVAKVNNGVVTPVGDGTATITVTCGEHSATCAVTVNAGLVAPVHVIELTPYDGSEEGELPFYKLDVTAGQVLNVTYCLTKQQGYIYDGRSCGMQYYGGVNGSAYPMPSSELGVETTKTITIVSNGTITFSGYHQETVANGELVTYAPDRVYGKYLYVTIT